MPRTDLQSWRLVHDDDFNRTVAEGQILAGSTRTVNGAPVTADGHYQIYASGWSDTSGHGRYDPNIISIHDGVLDIHIRYRDGYPRVAALRVIPSGSTSQGGLYGLRYEVRIRADSMHGYKGVPMAWADDAHTDDEKVEFGEIDGPESDFDQPQKAHFHRRGGVVEHFDAPGSPSWQDWHVWAMEWIPGTSVEYFLDGVSFARSTTGIPTTNFHHNLQFETSLSGIFPSVFTTGHVEIDYVSVWHYDATVLPPLVDPPPVLTPPPPPVIPSHYPTGTPVVFTAGSSVTVPILTGDNTVTVASVVDLIVGQLLAVQIPGSGIIEYRSIISIVGLVVTLSSGLTGDYSGGDPVVSVSAALGTMQVYTRGGALLGAISKFNITSPRSRSISLPGQMSFEVPVNHPDAALIGDDRLVVVTSASGGGTWLGTMGRQEWTDSKVTVNTPDAFELLTRAPLKFTDGSVDPVTGAPTEDELTIEDNTFAADLYALVIKKVNDEKSKHCEVTWGLDTTGCLNVFRGDLPPTGDGFSYISTIADRSQTEFVWRADGPNPTLVVRDKFDAGAGPPLFDGPGGNIMSQPTYVSDPTNRISSLKLTGQPSYIAKWVPAWGGWAVHEVTPEVDIDIEGEDCADGPRWRRDEQISVDWGLSKTEQKRLAALTTARLWRMFYTYLYAYHDLRGMPFYDEKWSYEGPPAEIEMDLTIDDWHTRNQMGLYHTTTPAHIVMDSPAHGQFVIVVYFRSTGTKVVMKLARSETYTYPVPTGTVPAGTTLTIYIVSGNNSAIFGEWTSDGSGMKLGAPQVVDGPAPTREGSMTVREILSGPFTGRYVNTSEADWTLTGADETLALSVGGQIGKVWPFERDRVTSWDPRRDGIGVKSNRASVLNGELRTISRWHFVRYTTGGGVTSLTAAVGVNDTVIFVESDADFPEPPFDIVVGDPEGNGDEGMRVTARFGSEWTVKRGTASSTTLTVAGLVGDTVIHVAAGPDATLVAGRAVRIHGNAYIVASVTGTAVTLKSPLVEAVGIGTAVIFTTAQLIHDTGSPVSLTGGDVFDGFKFPYTWPEGEAYARDLLARLNKPRILLLQKVTTRYSGWNVDFGSMCPITYTTEGPAFSGTGRVIGWAPDEASGTMEIVVEVV